MGKHRATINTYAFPTDLCRDFVEEVNKKGRFVARLETIEPGMSLVSLTGYVDDCDREVSDYMLKKGKEMRAL